MDNLDCLKSILKARAVAEHGATILPVGGRASFDECFRIDEGLLIFWFDTPDQSTHITHTEL